MTYIITILGFVILIILAFWLTFRQGKKHLSFSIASIFSVLLIFCVVKELGYVTTFLMTIMFTFLIIFISYWTLINLHFKKTGKIIAIVLTVLALLPFLSLAFEDYFFFKSDARKMLKENQIELKDKFKIKANHITGLNDLYQKFVLEISPSDKEQIIQQLRRSPYFKENISDEYSLQADVGSGLTKKVYSDYEKQNIVCRETYQKLRTGYTADYDIISISKNDNILTFERINE